MLLVTFYPIFDVIIIRKMPKQNFSKPAKYKIPTDVKPLIQKKNQLKKNPGSLNQHAKSPKILK